MIACKICSGNFKDSPDMIILCSNADGFVHMGCCMDICSLDKKPCMHAKSIYEKVNYK